MNIWILLSEMDSKQEQADPLVPEEICIPGQYPNQPGPMGQYDFQQQGNYQMYDAPPAYLSTAQYQPVAPIQYQPGLVMV